jgi:hypothetical protein
MQIEDGYEFVEEESWRRRVCYRICGRRLIEILGRYLNAMKVQPGMWLSTVVICLWPTGIALIETSNNSTGQIAFLFAAIANGLLYALIAVLVYCTARLAKNGDWDDAQANTSSR